MVNSLIFRKSGQLFLTITVLTLIYTNCAQHLKSSWPSPQKADEVSNDPVVHLQNKLALQYHGNLTEKMCFDSSRYFCDQRVFSPDVQPSQTPTQHPCIEVSQGGQICASGFTININSRYREQHCRENPTECAPSESRFEEYVCYFGLVDLNGLYPIHSSSSNLEEGLRTVLDSCLDVVHKSQTQ